MKKVYRFGLQLMLLSVMSCSFIPEISGVIKHSRYPRNKIYLLKPEKLLDVTGPYLCKIIDSAAIDSSNGKFRFFNLPKSDSLQLFILTVQPSGKPGNYLEIDNPLKANYMPFIWDSKNTLEISSNYDAFQALFNIKNPNKANKTLLELRDISRQNYFKYLAGIHKTMGNDVHFLDKEKARLNYQKSLIDFTNKTNQFLPAMVALRWVSPVNDYERVPEFLVNQCNKWQKLNPGNPWVKQLCSLGDPNKLPVLKGDTFPNLELPLISGDSSSVKNLLGKKLTIIDLWASWCAPCRKENREFLVPLWDNYHSKGLNIIAYGLESDLSYWRTAVKRDGADRWHQASDLQGDDGDFLHKIRVRTIPANYILDAKGVVIAKNIHGQDLNTFVENYFK